MEYKSVCKNKLLTNRTKNNKTTKTKLYKTVIKPTVTCANIEKKFLLKKIIRQRAKIFDE